MMSDKQKKNAHTHQQHTMADDDDDKEKDERSKVQLTGSALVVIIIVLIVSTILAALSSKGIHQWGCKGNWNTIQFFLANVLNSYLLGIPGFVCAYHFRNSNFYEIVKN